MGDKTGISWTEATLNFVTGCTPVSKGCNNCYARSMAKRLRGMGSAKYQQPFSEVVCHDDPELFSQPKRWTRPRQIFVNSMGDLFHESVSFEYLDRVYQAMMDAPQHIYQVLTKRPERMRQYLDQVGSGVSDNIWHGTSVESMDTIGRVEDLLNTSSVNIFLSMEPLLGPIDYPLSEVDWIIVGGESGPRAREMKVEWVESVFGSAYKGWNQMHPPPKIFVKQMGTAWAKANGSHTHKGDDMEEWPDWARIREVPWE